MELVLLLIVLLLVFGPKRLPEMGRSVGRGIREFKDSLSGDEPPERAQPETQPAAVPPPAPAVTTEPVEQKNDTERIAS
jgi:sec-independent protein translocase protein TatA